jgi:cytochrome P450 family 110
MLFTDTVARLSEPVANLMETGRNPYGLMERLYREHGDMCLYRLAAMPTVYVCADPDGVKQVLTGSYDQFERFAGGVELFVGPRALILHDGEPHRARRKLMNPGFNAESVRAFGPAMLEITDRVLARQEPGRTLSLLDSMQDITMRVIMRCIFGVAEGPRFEELRVLTIEYLKQIFSPTALAFGVLMKPARAQQWMVERSRSARASDLDAGFTPSRWPLLGIADRLGRIHALLEAEIDRCVAQGPETRHDVLAMLLQIRFEDGTPMSREELVEQLLMLLIGGYETTSMSLCWAVHCLISNPASLARVREELQTVMGDRFDPARVRDLNYLGAAIQESMRLNPIAIGVSRKLRVPMRIAGKDLQPGEIVMASIYLLQRNPNLYPEPDKFKPERMLEKRPPPWQFFPFGGGAWRCLGAAFAEHEMRVVLARLFTLFDVSVAPGVTVRAVQRGITVGPEHGLPVRLTRRG